MLLLREYGQAVKQYSFLEVALVGFRHNLAKGTMPLSKQAVEPIPIEGPYNVLGIGLVLHSQNLTNARLR